VVEGAEAVGGLVDVPQAASLVGGGRQEEQVLGPSTVQDVRGVAREDDERLGVEGRCLTFAARRRLNRNQYKLERFHPSSW
jgi:hypothetical protein